MAIISIPRNDFGSALGLALGGGFESGVQNEMQQQRQQQLLNEQFRQKQAVEQAQQSRLAQGLAEAQQIWSNPGLTDEQKIFQTNQLLGPSAAKGLIGQLQASQKQTAGNKLMQQFFPGFGGEQPPSPLGEALGGQRGDIEQGKLPSQAPSQTQNPNDPSTWSDSTVKTLRAFKGQPGDAGIIGNLADIEADKREKKEKDRTAKEKQIFKINEPKLIQLSEQQQKLDQEKSRFLRMQELDIDSSKFPSPLMAAILSKDGQINDIAYSQLTPEAQEYIKLIIDSTSNIKDTYGARVTNFDLQTYLKKLPSLLMSAEGRQRVLRDLLTINSMNELHNTGIQEIFENAGGSDKIPFSTAENIFRKKYGKQLEGIKQSFVKPPAGLISSLPSAEKHLGQMIEDTESGEVFISNGKDWVPFKE